MAFVYNLSLDITFISHLAISVVFFFKLNGSEELLIKEKPRDGPTP